MRILIATADHKLAMAYADRLGRSHFDVRQSDHQTRVLQDSLDFAPDLILIDTELGIGEHDILDILHHTPETTHTKVMLLTTLIDPAARARAHELGAVDIIIKSPATIPDVIARIHHHLRRPIVSHP